MRDPPSPFRGLTDGGDAKPEEYAEVHAIGALSVPLFQPIEGNSWEKVRRRAAYAALGVFNGTEENGEFLATVDGLVEGARDTPVMLICRNGGSVEETPGNQYGERSKSLVAAYKLMEAGYTSIFYVEGGLTRWFKEGLPTTLTHDEVPAE